MSEYTIYYHQYHQWAVSNKLGVVASFNTQEEAEEYVRNKESK